MNLGKDNLIRLQGSLLLLAAAIAAGAALVYAAGSFAKAMQARQGVATAQLAEARGKLQSVQQQRDDLRNYLAPYQALIQQGVLGEGRRLDWVEAVEVLRQRHGLFSAIYLLEARKPSASPIAAQAQPGFDLFESPMRLELALLHEDQLFEFLRNLGEEARGLYQIDRCALTRTAPAREIRYAPQLKANCVLNWVTMVEKK